MKIGELARTSGVSARSLRYYEEQGLISPSRDPAGRREYHEDDGERVIAIQELYAAGFCSSVIRDVLPRILDDETDGAECLRRAFAEARERLSADIRDIRRELDVLQQLEQRVTRLAPADLDAPEAARTRQSASGPIARRLRSR